MCDIIRCMLEDGDVSAETLKDSKGIALAHDRFWNNAMESMIPPDNEGPYMNIELSIGVLAKVGNHFNVIILNLLCHL